MCLSKVRKLEKLGKIFKIHLEKESFKKLSNHNQAYKVLQKTTFPIKLVTMIK